MEGDEKLLLVKNRLREYAFSLNRKVKEKVFMHKAHPEWCPLSEVEEERKKCRKAFKHWKKIEGRIKENDSRSSACHLAS